MAPLIKRLPLEPDSAFNLIAYISVVNTNSVYPPILYTVVAVVVYAALLFSTVLCLFALFKMNISGDKINNIISGYFFLVGVLIIPLASIASAFYMDETNLVIN